MDFKIYDNIFHTSPSQMRLVDDQRGDPSEDLSFLGADLYEGSVHSIVLRTPSLSFVGNLGETCQGGVSVWTRNG